MRTQAERDEQTLDIAGAVLGAAAAWLALVALVAIGVRVVSAADELVAVAALAAFVGYPATVVALLVRARRRRR